MITLAETLSHDRGSLELQNCPAETEAHPSLQKKQPTHESTEVALVLAAN